MDVRLKMIKNIIACLLCRKTYHMVCANVKTKSFMYVCTDCSESILQIKNIKKHVKNIHQTLKKENKSLQERLDQKNDEGENQAAVIADLHTNIATLTDELNMSRGSHLLMGLRNMYLVTLCCQMLTRKSFKTPK